MEDLKHIWTVGHSQRTLEEFTRLLLAFNIGAVADVRRYPISARFPHFNEMHLFKSLTRLDIEYEAFTNLGGRRRPHCDSPNLLLHNESFRGYADYMLTEPFHEGIERLVELAGQKRTAILCSEALWWRCHRSMKHGGNRTATLPRRELWTANPLTRRKRANWNWRIDAAQKKKRRFSPAPRGNFQS